MKKSLTCRLTAAGTALSLSALMIFPAFASEISISEGPGAQVQTEVFSDLSEAQIALGPGYAVNQTLLKVSDLETGNQNGPGAQAVSVTAETAEAGEYLGSFEASGYCSCSDCSGGYSLTYSGTVPQANHTIAADLDIFPIGTRLVIDGVVYTVEDMGGGINGNRLDIYFASHEDALAFGLQTIDVYAPRQSESN